MCIQKLRGIFFEAAVLILLGGCNQMDTVLLSTGSYQVDALVGQFSLNEYSVIAAGDTVLPYFVNSVRGDPDLDSLVLYVEDGGQRVLGPRVSYAAAAGWLNTEKDTEDRVPGAAAEKIVEEGGKGEAGKVEKTAETGDGDGDGEEVKEGGKRVNNFVPPAVEEVTIRTADFTGKLPPFPLPEGLEIGGYTLVFEIRGVRGVLSRARQPFYYIGDQKFTVGEIRHYLPEFSENKYLVSQGLTVMLEVPVEYGGGLDPYIIWYNGKNKISEGFAAAGMDRLLWAAPLRSGFHTVRAELFPFKPQTGPKGRVKEFSLPVSPKNDRKAAAGGAETGEYLYRYQFAGDLLEDGTGVGLDPVQRSELPLSWYPAEQVYGLGLRAGDIYETPGYTLDLSKDEWGELKLFIRALSLEDGGIFTASLGSSLRVGLALKEEALILELEGQGQVSRISGVLQKSGRDPAFTGVLITVKFEEARVSACMAAADSPIGAVPLEAAASGTVLPEEPPLSGWAEVILTEPAAGRLRSRIGRAAPKDAVEETAERPPKGASPVFEDAFDFSSIPPVLVVDDFSALFRRIPYVEAAEEIEEPVEAVEKAEAAGALETAEKAGRVEGDEKNKKPEMPVDGAGEGETAGAGDSKPDGGGLLFSGLQPQRTVDP
jgi:hypothetical protein